MRAAIKGLQATIAFALGCVWLIALFAVLEAAVVLVR